MRNRRILHVIDSLSIGGAEKLLVELSRRSLEEGHQVAVAHFTEGPLSADLLALGIEPFRLSKHKLSDPRAAIRLWRLLGDFRPDVVHTHLSKSDVLAQPIAALARVPVRVSTIHNVDPWRRSPLWSRVMRTFTAGTHHFVAVSHEVERFARRWGGCDEERLVTIPNGIDTDRFDPKKKPRVDDTIVVGAVGRLTEPKNHAQLIDAAAALRARHPQLRVAIYGTGPLKSDLQQQINRLGVADIVRLAGTTDDMPAAMAGLDILAFPSRFEGLPVALLEGMAMELPVLATSVGGVPDVVDHLVDGWLVPSGDPDGFTAALDRLLTDAKLRHDLGTAARKKIEKEYTAEMNASRLHSLYDQTDGCQDGPLRVLSVTKSTGGLASYNTRLVQLLAAKGLEVEVACLSENGPQYAAELGAKGIPATALPMSRYRLDPLGDTRLAMRLRDHIRRGRYDVVIGHGSKAGFLVRLVGRLTATPAVYGLASLSFVTRTQGRKGRIYRVLEKLGSRLGGEIVTVAHSTRHEVLANGVGRADKVTAIHTGVDLADFTPVDKADAQAALDLPPNSIVVGWAARFVTQKAPEVFVEAVSMLNDLDDVVFVMAGDGPLFEMVSRSIAHHGLAERLRLVPWQSDVVRFYSALDVYVLTSRWEGLPQSLLEAMALGVAPVSTDVDGNSEVIEHQLSGMLAPADDPAAIASQIRTLVENHELRTQIGQAAHRRIETSFTNESMVDDWVRLLVRLGRGDGSHAGEEPMNQRLVSTTESEKS